MTEKEKYLASAQKHVLKGNFDRAITDYEQLVALDPQDLRHRQRLAELLVRVNRKDDAIREYETIGKFYYDNAYYLKSIAVYKQIQKLAPQNMEIALILGELNEKQGLKGNALAEYQVVTQHHENAGEFGEAAKVLERMLALDQENIDTRIKLAEINLRAGLRERSYREFLRTAILLGQKHDDSGFNRICDRIRELFPDQKDFVLDLAQEQVRNGQADEAALFLQVLLEQDDSNPTVWNLLAEAYSVCNDRENLKDTYIRMSVLFPQDLAVREKLLVCLVTEGNADEALTHIESCIRLFPAERLGSLEQHLLKLSQIVPLNLRPLLALRDLYERTGALTRLADIENRLEQLRKLRTHDTDFDAMGAESPADAVIPDTPSETTEAAEEAIEQLPVEPSSFGDITVSEHADDETPSHSWTEEIEISLEVDTLPVEEVPTEREEEYGDIPTGQPPVPQTELASVPEELLPESMAESFDGPPPADPDEGAYEFFVTADDDGNDDGSDDAFADFPEIVIDIVAPEQTPPDELLADTDTDFDLDLLMAPTMDPPLDTDMPSADGATSPEAQRGEKYSIDGQISAFKKGLDGQIDRDDTETHYNLGIAYKEMGLSRDAVEEFRIAARNPLRRVDALLLQGICLREAGEVERARDILYAALEEGNANFVEAASIRYELGIIAEKEGAIEEARAFYRDIRTELPGFRDVAERLKLLGDVLEDESALLEPDEVDDTTDLLQ